MLSQRSGGAEVRQPFDLWGQRGWCDQEVVGEASYTKEIRSLFGRSFNPEGTEIELQAQLIPEPENRYDRNAVKVAYADTTIGYLPREDAKRYFPVLSRLVAQGYLPQLKARVWGGERTDVDYDRRGRPTQQKRFMGSVRVDLAEPHMLVPANAPPDAVYAMLPSGNAIQVTGEENHMADLVHLLSADGEAWVYATLHEIVEQLARSSRHLVEVHLDGKPAGKLTPKMSSELLPAVRHLAEIDATACCRAILKGNRVKADLVLYVARANEISQSWLDDPPLTAATRRSSKADLIADNNDSDEPPPRDRASSDQAVVKREGQVPAATAWRFNPPPGWPAPPPGWTPPAPAGWQWWVADTPEGT
jgi:hypothetical protein